IKLLKSINKGIKKIYLLTHFPPKYHSRKNKLLELFWKPYNSSKNLYDMLTKNMKNHPTVELHVLCGHTHFQETQYLSKNIIIHIGSACLGNSSVFQIIKL